MALTEMQERHLVVAIVNSRAARREGVGLLPGTCLALDGLVAQMPYAERRRVLVQVAEQEARLKEVRINEHFRATRRALEGFLSEPTQK